jgi:hypothetical protein
LHWLRATRAATKLLRRLATLPLLRHRLLLLRTQRLLLRALQLLRATLRLLLRTLVLLLRAPLLLRTLALLLRLRAQASKLYSRGIRPDLRLQRISERTAGQPDIFVRCTAGKQKSHEREFVAFLLARVVDPFRSMNTIETPRAVSARWAPRRLHASCM